MITDYLYDLFIKSINNIGFEFSGKLFFEEPKNPEHGDYSTNIALQLTKTLGKPPRNIAEIIIENLEYDKSLIEWIKIAGAGFINIKFKDLFFIQVLDDLIKNGNQIGKSKIGNGKKVNVEYVSVNPTGLLHLGHARNAAIGDTIANLLEWNGYDVTREYYFNNAGNQMNNLAKSIYARYRQLLGDDYPFPEDGYHGDYIITIAEELKNEYNDNLILENPENLETCKKFGEAWCFSKIKATLERMNIKQDIYFNEDSLYKEGKIDSLITEFRNLGIAYDKDGAVWLALSKLGLNDDRVIVKSTGEPTYRLPDIAYHREKFLRGYDLIIDILGADHIATVPDVLAGIKSLGFDDKKVKVIIHQFVTLTENGEQVKMSKRTGKNYTLDDLLDEISPDVVRFFLIMRGVSTHLEFDLNLAREQSEKNPVFYLQYAHARICSIINLANERDIKILDEPNLQLLKLEAELSLIKKLIKFPEIVNLAGEKFEPQILADFLRELAASFHYFYHECRILNVEDELQSARMALTKITKHALSNGLSILGISAPEKM